MADHLAGVGYSIDFDEAEMYATAKRAGQEELLPIGEMTAQEAKRLAPVSADGSNGRPSGYLRNSIGYEYGEDEEGPYINIGSHAFTPQGFDYGLAQELGPLGPRRWRFTPHLRPALANVMHSVGGEYIEEVS